MKRPKLQGSPKRAASTFGIAVAMVLAWGTVRLNAQELITNGSFSNGLTNWTQTSWAGGSFFGTNANGPADTSASSGNYAYAGGGAFNLLQQNVTLIPGNAYRLSFLAGGKSGGGTTFGYLSLRQDSLGNYNSASFDYFPTAAVFGSYTVDFIPSAATVGLWLRNDGASYAAYDNVSITAIPSIAHALNYSAAGGFTEITSALSGTGKVSVNAGAGGLTLKGANSHTGGTEVTGGTLYVVGSGTLGAAGGTVTVSNAILDLRNQQTRTGTISTVGQNARIIGGDLANPGSIVNNGGALQFGGGQISVPISGTGGLNVTGGGSLNASNSFTGDVTISDTTGWYGANSLFVDNANGLGADSGNLTMSGGIVSLQNNTVTRSGNLTISGGTVQTGTFSKSGTDYVIRSGNLNVVLAGTAGLTKSSTNGAVFNAVNTYTGDTTVNEGTLLVNGTLSDAAGALTVSGSGNLDLRSQQTRTGTITMNSQTARILSGDGNGSIVNNGGAFQFGGGWLDAGLSGMGGMNVTGGGKITSSNSYTGNTIISNTTGWFGTDTLYVENANGLGAASGDLTVSGGILNLYSNTITRSGNLTISGASVLNNGTISKSGTDYDIQGGTIRVALAGTAGVTKSSTNGAALNAANTYTGDTTINGGTLYVGGSGTLGAAGGALTVAGSGSPSSYVTLDLRSQQTRTGTISMTNQDARIISGNGSGSIVNNGGAFQFGGGSLEVALSGSGGMNVTGGGRITSSNSYTGATTISGTAGWYGANAFFTESAHALGAASGNLTVSGGIVNLYGNTITRSGNLTITGGTVANGTLSKSGTAYDIQGGTIGAVLAGTAGLTKSGASSAVLSAANTYTGGTTVTGGTLTVIQPSFTATITPIAISVTLSNSPSGGQTFQLLPGSLAGSYGTPIVSPLGTGQTASFDAATGILSITQGVTGPTFDTAYPGISLTDVAPNGLTYLMNYAFGGSSTQAATLPSQDVNDPTKLTLVAYVRTNNAVGTLSVVGEKGDSLSNFDPANPILGQVASDQSSAPAGTQKQIFSVPANGNRLFLRLKATLQP